MRSPTTRLAKYRPPSTRGDTASTRTRRLSVRAGAAPCGGRCGGKWISGRQGQGTEGTARVAWNTSSYGLPIVQCVKVRRGGNPISGLKVELLVVSRRIASDAACPARY